MWVLSGITDTLSRQRFCLPKGHLQKICHTCKCAQIGAGTRGTNFPQNCCSSCKLAASAWEGIPVSSRNLGSVSLALRSLAVRQLWSRAPLSDTFVLDKNSLSSSGNLPMALPVLGTKSPICFSSKRLQWNEECWKEHSMCWVYVGKAAVVGRRWTCCSIFERGDSFIES